MESLFASMHLHMEFLTMEAVLEHSERMQLKNAGRNSGQYVLHAQTGRQYTLESLFLLLEKKKKNVSVGRGFVIFFVPASLSRYANSFTFLLISSEQTCFLSLYLISMVFLACIAATRFFPKLSRRQREIVATCRGDKCLRSVFFQ